MKIIFQKYKTFFIYSIFGFLASVINIYTFNVFHISLKYTVFISNTLAWFIANLFSFFCNKHIVFRTTFKGINLYFKELISFYMSRGISWVADMLFMYIGLLLFATHPVVVKIIDQLFIGIFNYLFTKFIFDHENRKIMKHTKKN